MSYLSQLIQKLRLTSGVLIWFIYLLLLGVLLPHTAWTFGKFEPTGYESVAWAAAFVFEAALAVLTHKLARHIETVPKRFQGWAKFTERYANAYGGGLAMAWGVSTLANLAHSVEFGQSLKIFTQWGMPAGLYAVAFGAILPTCSLLFARILSNVIEANDSDGEPNPELIKAGEEIRSLRARVRQVEQERNDALQRANDADVRFQAAGDMLAWLMAESKRERIIAAVQRWPQLPNSAIAIITETSPSFVSEVKSEATR